MYVHIMSAVLYSVLTSTSWTICCACLAKSYELWRGLIVQLLICKELVLYLQVDKALQSMEEEAERIFQDERVLLREDEAASARDTMLVW